MSRDDDTLIAAYLDGVSELAMDERRRVEQLLADSPPMRDEADALRAVIGKLRELPPQGREPDWTAMALAISAAAGPIPHPWWRRWQWLIPVGTLAMTAAAALIWLRHPEPTPMEARQVPIHDTGLEAPVSSATANALWLDGEAFDLDEVEPSAFENLDREALATGPAGTDDVTEGILPATDLNWIDGLDDGAIDRAEHWLDRKKS